MYEPNGETPINLGYARHRGPEVQRAPSSWYQQTLAPKKIKRKIVQIFFEQRVLLYDEMSKKDHQKLFSSFQT